MILCDDRATFCIISYIQVFHFKTKIYTFLIIYTWIYSFKPNAKLVACRGLLVKNNIVPVLFIQACLKRELKM